MFSQCSINQNITITRCLIGPCYVYSCCWNKRKWRKYFFSIRNFWFVYILFPYFLLILYRAPVYHQMLSLGIYNSFWNKFLICQHHWICKFTSKVVTFYKCALNFRYQENRSNSSADVWRWDRSNWWRSRWGPGRLRVPAANQTNIWLCGLRRPTNMVTPLNIGHHK